MLSDLLLQGVQNFVSACNMRYCLGGIVLGIAFARCFHGHSLPVSILDSISELFYAFNGSLGLSWRLRSRPIVSDMAKRRQRLPYSTSPRIVSDCPMQPERYRPRRGTHWMNSCGSLHVTAGASQSIIASPTRPIHLIARRSPLFIGIQRLS